MLYIREATIDDIDLLFNWANDPVVRANSFNQNTIPYETHVSWFNRMIKDETVIQYILMDEDVAVGQIRLNIDSDEAEIGYSIAPDFRGKGYGKSILRLMAEKVKKEHPEIRKLVAKVKPENTASRKLFEGAKYDLEYLCYVLES